MGVPSFFRWLHRQYPMIISNCIERRDNRDSSKPNPNTEGDKEFDCLYLDMNGIIHPCFHPEGIAPPRSEEEIYRNIEKYILRLFNIVRPRQLLFMAIDGVAPRAKMNQQRMRRFRSAKDNAYNRDKQLQIAHDKGDTEQVEILSDPDYLKKHDSNVITPGTEFFQRLSKHLHKFIKDQIENDPGWKNILVILSDASIPGEGEHKIMKFIRSQRLQPHYNPNRRHVIYGLDADLIFLGLASHEAYFTIIRENVIDITEKNPERDDIGPEFFHFLNLWVLRQYLERDLQPDPNQGFQIEWNLEYALDDFVFLCFGAGNDFIPSMPGFSVHQGAVRTILRVYKKTLSRINRWVTQRGLPDFYALKELFKQFTYGEIKELDTILNPDKRALDAQKFVNSITDVEEPKYDEKLEEEAGLINNGNPPSRQVSRKSSANNDRNPEEMKAKYYKEKFGFSTPSVIKSEVPKVSSEFVRGMIWVLQYYLYGVPSWNWYYPYHYAPCASDISLLGFNEDYNFYRFDKTKKPFDPLIQLMSVLPPQSSHAVPPVIRYLMADPKSPLHEFYPTKFKVDLNGGTAIWKGVIHIPFIDEEKLFDVINSTDLALTFEEKKRNEIGKNYIFMGKHMAPEKYDIEFCMNGPIWGKLMLVNGEDYNDKDKKVFMYSINYPSVPDGTPMSFLLPGVEIPPYVIDTVIDTHKFDTFYDKNTIDQDAIEKSFELPLQIPGYAPGASINSRHKTYERAKYLQDLQQPQQNQQNYPQKPPSILPAQPIQPQQMPMQYPPYAAPYPPPPPNASPPNGYYPYPPQQYPPQQMPPTPPQQQHHHHYYYQQQQQPPQHHHHHQHQ
ncbi:hypothetical protein M9Y10_008363 [Tritrichomonas musculus]|uniref:Uncharacterized protein n=1 Tax=Tritrichomonas musculus TaxID=1915356 RepID=A0ABR2IYX9_9EUKA